MELRSESCVGQEARFHRVTSYGVQEPQLDVACREPLYQPKKDDNYQSSMNPSQDSLSKRNL